MKQNRFEGLTKIAYAICYVILVFCLLVKVRQCVENFLVGTTFYETSMVLQGDTKFPEITFCSRTSHGLKEDVLQVT